MTLDIKRKANETTIKIVGRLDAFTAPSLGKIIEQNARDAENIILELSGLESISDIALRALLEVSEKIRPTSSLRLTAVSDGVMNTLMACGCTDVLAIN